ncbi:A/G-specific adenine glycosylase [Rickettsiella massiliensis]|uniref:A/G-specific adenine glycosylase n=1 Tax=Rickettsiella massiliensis TaxID=676517 RepID=UPI00029A4A26|nr:A/G-specific adenine glycosylase [Rickettsiella massiliensis]
MNITPLSPAAFQHSLLRWFKQHGRKQLPWKTDRSPYRIWLSEIMLQQTQVKTVIPYFGRFVERFPTICALAAAPIDDVLQYWAGLGYYARARHLHTCAQRIVADYQGEFPRTLEALQTLPGIGRSTAGAILAFAFGESAPILDGNVKRVLCRVHAQTGWPGLRPIEEALWKIAAQYTPRHQVAEYTQAIMDLGALICKRSKPDCLICPIQKHCLAYQQFDPQQFPTPKPKTSKPTRSIRMLLLINDRKEILLEKRPASGIWGGLWSLPECSLTEDIPYFAQTHYGCQPNTKPLLSYPVIAHSFSHFQLKIHPIQLWIKKWSTPAVDSRALIWYNTEQLTPIALAAPVKKLLSTLPLQKM